MDYSTATTFEGLTVRRVYPFTDGGNHELTQSWRHLVRQTGLFPVFVLCFQKAVNTQPNGKFPACLTFWATPA